MEHKYTKEEIINAVTVIKEICANQICQDCPFFRKGDNTCIVKNEVPSGWKINEDKPVTWRALL